MATRKRTKDVVTLVAEATLSDDIVVGSHLTVITHGDGTTTLKWDDKALLKDVRAAIATVDQKSKTTRTKK